jgi:hypothetical protein
MRHIYRIHIGVDSSIPSVPSDCELEGWRMVWDWRGEEWNFSDNNCKHFHLNMRHNRYLGDDYNEGFFGS